MNKNLIRKTFYLSLLFTFLFMPFSTLATFNPNLIMTDTELTDYTSMTMNDIQNFLASKNSVLTYYVDPNVRMYAYQIIYDSAQLYKINPKYILSLLQKEQGLITNPTPTMKQFDWAVGYGCLDGQACNNKYKGFGQQIDWGTGGTRYYFDHPEEFKYQIGKTYKIDGQSVTMINNATRTFYTYTPHIHGQELLYSIYNKWFGLNELSDGQTSKYPDGVLLQNKKDGGIWLIENGLKRPFTSKSAFLSRYSLEKVIAVDAKELDAFEKGEPINRANYSLLKDPTGKIYLLDDNKLRHIENEEIFRNLGFNPEEIENITTKEVQSYTLGEPINMKSAYPTGALLQDNKTGGVYYVKLGKKYPIWDKALLKLYFSDKKIIPVSPDELAKYLRGPVVKLKNGELVKAPNKPIVYFISNKQKLPIANVETFESLGYKWNNIIKISEKILNLHQTGKEIRL